MEQSLVKFAVSRLKEFVFNRLTTDIPNSYVITPPSRINYSQYIKDGMQASVLMAPVQWIQTNFQQAELEVVREVADKTEAIKDHPLVKLINAPNPFYRGDALWNATILSYILDGNCYWLKKRSTVGDTPWYSNVAGKVQELWYAPHWTMEPKWPAWDDSIYISHYQYSIGGQRYEVSPENVIHFRNGIDPRNTRKGISKIEPLLSEIFTDEEAASWVAALLLNRGIPGVVISPEKGMPEMDNDMREAMAAKFIEKTTGARRGSPLVTSGAIKVDTFGFNPGEMDLGDIRNTPEERVCAMLGIPAAVVGFGTGLQQTKVGATMRESRASAWEDGIIPMQRTMAADLQQSLLPEFGDVSAKTVRFNQDDVEALKDTVDQKISRVDKAVQGGWLRVDLAQREAGFPVDPSQALYLRAMNVIEVPASDPAAKGYGGRGKKGSLIEQMIVSGARDGQVSAAQQRLISTLNRQAVEMEKAFEAKLLKFFASTGEDFEAATLVILGPKGKKDITDEMNANAIMDLVDIERLQKELSGVLGAHYFDVAKSTYSSVSLIFGVATDLSDDRAQEIIKMGGRRVGLIDLEEQTRKRLMRELAAGRENGDGPVKLARTIRDLVPAGPWSTPQVRSRVIARTETLHAQRASTLDSFRDSRAVDDVMVFDNRTGFDDPECSALDGKIVSLDEAYALMGEEHPNGTRSFSPVIR